MALELKRQNLESESVVSTRTAQLNVQADAMISGAGRDAVEVLMEDAAAHLSRVDVQEGRVAVEGVVVCQAAYRQSGADVIRAVEARAQLQHSFEDEAIASGMNACVDALVTHVESGCLNGRLLFRITVELRCVVSRISADEVLTQIDGAEGIETGMAELDSVRWGAEAQAQMSLSETLSLPRELETQATLLDLATVAIDSAERDLGGVTVSGRVNAEVLLTGGMPGKPVAMVKYPLPFRQLVEMPEWLTENVQPSATVDSIRSELTEVAPGEVGLKLDADITLRVRAVQTQQLRCVTDAYAVGECDIETEIAAFPMTTQLISTSFEETCRGTVLIPDGMPAASGVLASVARVSAANIDSGAVEGVLEVVVMYMPADGEQPVTVRDELPFRIANAQLGEGMNINAQALSCEATALMNDRLEVRCPVRFTVTGRTETTVHAAVSAREAEAAPRKRGIVMYWPGKEESLWSIGRKYRIPVDSVRRVNGGDEVVPGKALILRI